MNLKNFKITHKGLYWGLIVTFALLYLCVGFVSTLHSITFFNLANSVGLAVLLGLTYEVGQASVLFSILMSEKNKNKFLPWALMFLLTALQVTANVYASFKFMATSGNNDWTYWQKSILIGVQAANPEMYQVIISWIAGALLPVVALGMTALVAQNMSFLAEEAEGGKETVEEVADELLKEESENIKRFQKEVKPDPPIPSREEQLEKFKDKVLSNIRPQTKIEEKPIIGEGGIEIIKPQFEVNLQDSKSVDSEGVEWEAKPVDLIGNTMSKLPNFKFTPPPPAEIDAELKPSETPFKTYQEIMNLPVGGKIDQIVENEVKRRLQEIEDQKNTELREESDILDEEATRLISIQEDQPIPEIKLDLETKEVKEETTQIPIDIVPEMGEPEIIIPKETLKQAEDAMRRELGEKIPFTKTRGWHLKKEYIDSNGDVYSFGKYVNPEEPKKA